MKRPYLQAFDAYHRDGRPHIPWTDVLDWHFQHGVVLSDERLFLMARLIPDDATPAQELSLTPFPAERPFFGTTWHIWAAAGDLMALAGLVYEHCITSLHFQRRSSRIHKVDAEAFYRRVQFQAEREMLARF